VNELSLKPRTIADIIRSTGPAEHLPELPAPDYARPKTEEKGRIVLAVKSMQDHMTDEGWQICLGLQLSFYNLVGHGLHPNLTDVPEILRRMNPGVVVVQDKREWDVRAGDFRDQRARFYGIECLKDRPEIFRLTVLKDAHQRPHYHRQSAEEIGCHGWIIYYHPQLVSHFAPYVRPKHLVRTYHSLDQRLVPPFNYKDRKGAILSGAVSRTHYPLRCRLVNDTYKGHLPQVTVLPHPGYHRQGCQTATYLQTLNYYKVAICTSSVYGYALRKIIEATACGCVVVTDLPADDVLPGIDANLVRIHPDTPSEELSDLLSYLYRSYNHEKQYLLSLAAKRYYNWQDVGARLAHDIEELRSNYP